MMDRIFNWIINQITRHPIRTMVLAVAITAGLQLAFALAGHPTYLWLWRDILGVLG